MHKITYTLMFVGALNWGLVGLFGFNLVEALLGSMPAVESLVYVLVGFSAIVELKNHMSCCGECANLMGETKKVGKNKTRR